MNILTALVTILGPIFGVSVDWQGVGMAVNPKSLENLKKGRKFTSETAKAAHPNSVKAKALNRTLLQTIEELDEDGTIGRTFAEILKTGREENRIKLLALFSQIRDKAEARKNGELDNRPLFVYEPMQFTEVPSP